MDFDTSDNVIALGLWIPAVAWSVFYSVGVIRWGWRRDSWKAILTTTSLGTVAASAGTALFLQTWQAGLVMGPVILPGLFLSCWLGFRTGARLDRSLHGD